MLAVLLLASLILLDAGTVCGVVRDSQGLVVPGIDVVLTSSAATQTGRTDGDGRFCFESVPPGFVAVRAKRSTFRAEARDVQVETDGVVQVSLELKAAGIREVVQVIEERGETSPAISNVLMEDRVKEVPSATNVWAVLGQTPGIRMLGYDVGGSHKATQISYEANGIRGQHRVVSDGVDSTEGVGGSGIYYDFYAVESFEVTTAGADVEMPSPGALVLLTTKSGGNELSGLYHLDYQSAGMVGDNVDAPTAERGFTGNPHLLSWETHADLGGPIVENRAWFYGAFNHYTLDKAVSGVDVSKGTDLSHFENYTAKLTWDVNDADRLVGYSQWGRKRRFNQGLSLLTPLESTRDRDSWSWVHKLEWQRSLSSRILARFEARHFGLQADDLAKSDPELNPERFDLATQRWSGSPGTLSFTRFKPQLAARLDAFEPFGLSSHSLKLGVEWFPDKLGFDNRASPIRYRDDSRRSRRHDVADIQFTNTPRPLDFVNENLGVFVQDHFSVGRRLTVTGGLRFQRQNVHYNTIELEPRFPELFFSGTVPGRSVVTWNTLSPRVGTSWDVTGNGVTRFQASFGRYVVNLANTLIGTHPSLFATEVFTFRDSNENGVFDGFHELGPRRFDFRASRQELSSDFDVTFADELSFSIERNILSRATVRGSFVRKSLKNEFGLWDVERGTALLSSPVGCETDSFECPLNPFTGESLRVVRPPDEALERSSFRVATYPDARYVYKTLSLSGEAQPRAELWYSASFDYQWRDDHRSVTPNRSPGVTDPISPGFFLNFHPSVPTRQTTTNWQARWLSRVPLPSGIGFAVNLRHQSGFDWAPVHDVAIPGSFSQDIFLSNLKDRRSENVTLLDLRVDKSFRVAETRVSVMMDVFNLLNSNAVTNFVLFTGPSFERIIAALDPRTFKVGLRLEF